LKNEELNNCHYVSNLDECIELVMQVQASDVFTIETSIEIYPQL
jgi:hypothetical protein